MNWITISNCFARNLNTSTQIKASQHATQFITSIENLNAQVQSGGALQLGLSRLLLHNKNLDMQKSGTFFSSANLDSDFYNTKYISK